MDRILKTVVALLLLVIGVSILNTPVEPASLHYKLYQYTETGPASWDLLSPGIYLGEYTRIGRINPIEFPVSHEEGEKTATEWRSIKNVTGVTGYAASVNDPDRVVLVDQGMNPLFYPPRQQSDLSLNFLYLNRDAKEVQVEGDLYEYTGWDGEEYHVLRVSHVNPYCVKQDPGPLDERQVELTPDQPYYYVNDTAKVTIRNHSYDWLHTGRDISLFLDVDGSWVEVQGYPGDYGITAELHLIFPGTSWSHKLPLYHLEPGDYKLVKEVWHSRGPRLEASTTFSVVEKPVSYANSTHVYGLRAVNFTLPTVPNQVPVPRVTQIPIPRAVAEEMAVNVFGFEAPYEVEGQVNPSIRKGDRRLEFTTHYDMLYHTDPGSYNDWSESEVLRAAENFLSKLERYWVDPTPLNYTIKSVGPSHISSGSTFGTTIREVAARYQLTLGGIPIYGPGADFKINVCRGEVSGCEIRRPVVSIEEYVDVTVTPREAIQLMLRGESATPELGFEVIQILPHGSELTINDVTLVYYTGTPGNQDRLIPVYVIRGVAHIDPVVFGEETSSFHKYIFATEYRPTP